ncbi:C6 finger domain-containing protein [Pleurostoma richardsiae]|uniref:C6 finger domain-containing protein n=1 Tax=Pleurostoma richardsiae TaxID=41990 RepID=A0AA38RLF2_9PEZI|nr:C6 finger domain-containing protein [Pleurostoma richardsiae]
MSSGAKRAAVACSFCRHRKRRCDGRLPQCRTCAVKGLECSYDEPALPRNSGDGRTDGTESQLQLQRLEAIEGLLREHSSALEALRCQSNIVSSPGQGPDVSRSPGRSAARSVARSIESPVPFSAWAFNHHDRHPSTPQEELDTTPALTIPLGHQTSTSTLLVLPQLRSLVGDYPDEFVFRVEDSRPRSAAVQSMNTSVGREQEPEGQGPIDKSVADRYIENFLTLVYPFHPFFDRDDLLARYEEVMSQGLGSDDQSALFYAILALGATASDPVDRSTQSHSGDVLVRKALKILFASWTLCFSGDILISQGLVLCALYFTYTVEPLMAWRFIHMASTNIQQILARCKDILSDEAEIQDITRISWVCFIIESDVLAEFHQPRSGIELLVDKMPFPNYGKYPTPENLYTLAEISARSLLNRIHHSIFYADSLTAYTGRALDNLTSVGAPPHLNLDASLLRVCVELTRQLETWYGSLDESIRPDLSGENVGSRQSCLLRLRYFSAMQNIYRPFVLYVSSQSPEQHIGNPPWVLEKCEACIRACRMFINTASHLLSHRTPYTYSATQYCFSCSLVLSIAARCPPLCDLVEDIEALQSRTVELLKPWAQPKSSVECVYEITCSILRKQRFGK